MTIGIDFSINSPSICAIKDGEYVFVSFFDDMGKDWRNSRSKHFLNHRILSENGIVETVPYTRLGPTKSDYVAEQKVKMRDAMALSSIIVGRMGEISGGDAVTAGIEGFSYASKGSSYIDLIMYNCFLRKGIMEAFGEDSLVVVSPSEAKKHFSGKGNANKDKMIDAFIEDYVGDGKIKGTKLWQYCSGNTLDYSNIKPIDDLVDSFSILKMTLMKYER